MRPDRLAGMTLGEFACDYRRLQPGRNGLQKAKDMIDPLTNLGPDTTHSVAVVESLMAPQCTMQLSIEIGESNFFKSKSPVLPQFVPNFKISVLTG